MEYTVIDCALGGLLHDIGKPYQRSFVKANLTEEELRLTPVSKIGYNTHLHSAYTDRFFRKYLSSNDEFGFYVSSHHKDEVADFAKIIRYADYIASAIDRSDEINDTEEKNRRGQFITARLQSIMGEVDFGKDRHSATIPLSEFTNIDTPI